MTLVKTGMYMLMWSLPLLSICQLCYLGMTFCNFKEHTGLWVFSSQTATGGKTSLYFLSIIVLQFKLQHFFPLLHRGLISLNSSDTYYLEPISSVDPVYHSLLSTKELPIKGGNCYHTHHTTHPNLISNLLTSFHSRVSLPEISGTPFLN